MAVIENCANNEDIENSIELTSLRALRVVEVALHNTTNPYVYHKHNAICESIFT